MKKHIGYNIKWNTDKELFDFLPKEIEIPEDVWEEYELDEDEDVISDYIIDLTGFPLYSYDIKEENIMNTMKSASIEDEDTRADVCITTEYDNGSGMYYSYKKSALEKIEEIIDEILEKDPQAEINISVDVE